MCMRAVGTWLPLFVEGLVSELQQVSRDLFQGLFVVEFFTNITYKYINVVFMCKYTLLSTHLCSVSDGFHPVSTVNKQVQ